MKMQLYSIILKNFNIQTLKHLLTKNKIVHPLNYYYILGCREKYVLANLLHISETLMLLKNFLKKIHKTIVIYME